MINLNNEPEHCNSGLEKKTIKTNADKYLFVNRNKK